MPGLRELQEERLGLIQARRAVPQELDQRYQAARHGMVELMQQVSLNSSRVEALVQQLFDVNKHLQGLEGKLLRLATSCRVTRESFLQNYMGHELDHDWLDRVARLKDRGWVDFVSRHYEEVESLRADIADIAEEAGLQISEFRRIVNLVQRGEKEAEPGQEGDGRGQPAPRDLDRQEIHQPRPAVPGPDPGGQHRPDEGRRQVRVPARLQVLDLRHLVDPPGDHPLDRRPGPHDPHPRAHDRDHQQAGARLAPDAARVWPRADARGARAQAQHAAWTRSARS